MAMTERTNTAIIRLARAATLIFIWVSLVYLRGPNLFYHDPEAGTPEQQDEDRAFIQTAAAVEFPATIDYAPLREACTRVRPTHFRPGLVFTCEDQHGGVGMLRLQILKCVRYAIHAGAAAVVPSLSKRNPHDITDIETTVQVPLDYLFDREAFVRHLTAGCPGMRLYDRVEDFPNYDRRAVEPLEVVGDQFEKQSAGSSNSSNSTSDEDDGGSRLLFPREWRNYFDNWLAQMNIEFSPEAPVHIKLGQTYLEYPVREDGDAFAGEFGKILSFRSEARVMAARVLAALHRRVIIGGSDGTTTTTTQQEEQSIDPSVPISPHAYYGAHLRLEKDAVSAWDPDLYRFSRMEDQFEEQFRNLRRTGLDVVYVASGNRTVVDLFAEYLQRRITEEEEADDEVLRDRGTNSSSSRNVTVVTKYDLLRGDALEELEQMTFDQQGLVDFLMMFKASAFMGVAYSSFPWTVALRRHELSRYRGLRNLGSDILRDEYSELMGMRADYPSVDPFDRGLWP
ncbi:hypothetical protein PG994_006530 [Apiospora phragmitis]|uniref:Alternative oxidase n=1 Tax=Apiospora phragmitis TaxID=2905665 RepID=A0ABR1VFA5_9PEZI